jgi:hypothetical protein
LNFNGLLRVDGGKYYKNHALKSGRKERWCLIIELLILKPCGFG